MSKTKYIKNPELLWGYFVKYKETVKNNPIFIVEQKRGNTIIPKDFEGIIPEDMNIVKLPMQKPLTMEGFENWCEDEDIISDLGDYFSNKNKAYDEYSTICSRIKRNIRQDQIEGGMVGIYNPSITQRLNGLAEKTDNVNTNIEQPFFPDTE